MMAGPLAGAESVLVPPGVGGGVMRKGTLCERVRRAFSKSRFAVLGVAGDGVGEVLHDLRDLRRKHDTEKKQNDGEQDGDEQQHGARTGHAAADAGVRPAARGCSRQ